MVAIVAIVFFSYVPPVPGSEGGNGERRLDDGALGQCTVCASHMVHVGYSGIPAITDHNLSRRFKASVVLHAGELYRD